LFTPNGMERSQRIAEDDLHWVERDNTLRKELHREL